MSRSLLAVVASLLLIPSAAEAGSITGRVLDVRGRPFASVNIEIVAADESPSGAPEQTPLKRISGSAKSDGVFRIQLPGDWPPSEIRVSATGTVRRRAFGVVTGADDLDLGLLTLPAAQVLQGIVRDESGRPIAGVLVRAIGVDSGADVLPGEGATDAAGRYVIVDAPQRVAQMILTHSDCVSQSAPSIRSTWVLRHGGAIEGIVVDDRGRPASQVRIGAADQVAVSSALGSFRLAGLAPGISHVLASDDEGGVA